MKPPSKQPAIRMMMMPKDTNAVGSIFGGVIMSLIDQAAFVEASRQAPRKFVTIAMDKVEFRKSVRQGTILRFLVEQSKRGRTSLQYSVYVYLGDINEYDKLIFSTTVTLVHVDKEGRKEPLPPRKSGKLDSG